MKLDFGRKKIIFYSYILEILPICFGSTQFRNILSNLNNLHKIIKNENPYSMFFSDDFNGITGSVLT